MGRRGQCIRVGALLLPRQPDAAVRGGDGHRTRCHHIPGNQTDKPSFPVDRVQNKAAHAALQKKLLLKDHSGRVRAKNVMSFSLDGLGGGRGDSS